MTADLRELLELASDDVPDLDLAQGAWEEARRQRRAVARRTAIGAGGVAALGGLIVVLREPAPAPVPAPTAAAATVGADGALPTATVGGATVHLAPDPPFEALLPRYPRAAELAIPRHLGPADQSIRAELGAGGLYGVAEPLRAVFLVVAEGGGYHPVLFAPDFPFHVEVPAVRINQWEGVQSALGPRSISDDRHRVVIPQPGRVIVLDARDGSVREFEVPDPTLSLAGWARDRTTVVARGRDGGWLLDPQTGSVRRRSRSVHPDWAELARGEGTAELRSFGGSGELTGSTPLRGPPVVPSSGSVSNTEGWVAGGAFLPGEFQVAVDRSQGLVAVHSDLPPMPRILAATQGPLVPKAAYRVLAWGPQDVVLFESRSERAGFQGLVRRVLAWDVNEGRLYQVADVDRAASQPGEFSGTYAL
ncbi:MAG TPA: hypothetical protein VES93_03455 [Ornithinibacter sp.]|nr:hypothetical protein [Ornithinibacter sp.]